MKYGLKLAIIYYLLCLISILAIAQRAVAKLFAISMYMSVLATTRGATRTLRLR